MARLAGKGGIIKVDNDGGGAAAAILGATGWSLNIAAETPEGTGLDSGGDKAFLAGLSNWDGTADGHWEATETDTVGAPPLLAVGTRIEVELWGRVYAAGPPELNTSYKGDALVSGFNPKVDVAGGVDWTLSFQGTETLTYPTS